MHKGDHVGRVPLLGRPFPRLKGVGDDSGIFSGNSFLQRCDGVVLGEKRFDLLRDAVEHRTEIADLLDKYSPSSTASSGADRLASKTRKIPSRASVHVEATLSRSNAMSGNLVKALQNRCCSDMAVDFAEICASLSPARRVREPAYCTDDPPPQRETSLLVLRQ